MILTVLSARPTARNRVLCSSLGTLLSAIQITSANISFLSVYSFTLHFWFFVYSKIEIYVQFWIKVLCIFQSFNIQRNQDNNWWSRKSVQQWSISWSSLTWNMNVFSLVFIDLLGQVFNQYHAENERKKWILLRLDNCSSLILLY